MKTKQLYIEKYRKPYPTILPHKLPNINHLAGNFIAISCELRAAGVVEVDGERLEFQDLRLIVKERRP